MPRQERGRCHPGHRCHWVASSTGGAVATNGAGVAEGTGPLRAPESLRAPVPLRAPGTLKLLVPLRAPGPPRAPGSLRAPEPMTTPGPLRVLTAGATEGAWHIWVVRGVIQGAEGPWVTLSTRVPYSLRLTEGIWASVPPGCAPVTAKYSFRCNIGKWHGLHPQTDN